MKSDGIFQARESIRLDVVGAFMAPSGRAGFHYGSCSEGSRHFFPARRQRSRVVRRRLGSPATTKFFEDSVAIEIGTRLQPDVVLWSHQALSGQVSVR